MRKILKPKKCIECKKEFMPYNPFQKVCNVSCAYENSKKVIEKEGKRNWINHKKILKEKLKTHSDWIQELQKVFNTFIRLRDKGRNCISCSTPLNGKFDAGHYYAAGNYSALRFNEDNVHGQCVHCNQHLHGNLIEYGTMLVGRIGLNKFTALHLKRHDSVKLSIPEIKLLINKYKNLCK